MITFGYDDGGMISIHQKADGHDMDFCHLCVQRDWALANVLPMVTLGRLHVDHLSRKVITAV